MQSDYSASKNQQKNQLTMNLQTRRNNYIKQFAKEDRESIIAQKRNRLNLNSNFLFEDQRFRIVDHPTITNQTIIRNVLNNQVDQDDNISVTSECSMSTVSSMQEEDQQNQITNEVNLRTINEKLAENKLVLNKTQIDDIFNY